MNVPIFTLACDGPFLVPKCSCTHHAKQKVSKLTTLGLIELIF